MNKIKHIKIQIKIPLDRMEWLKKPLTLLLRFYISLFTFYYLAFKVCKNYDSGIFSESLYLFHIIDYISFPFLFIIPDTKAENGVLSVEETYKWKRPTFFPVVLLGPAPPPLETRASSFPLSLSLFLFSVEQVFVRQYPLAEGGGWTTAKNVVFFPFFIIPWGMSVTCIHKINYRRTVYM